MLKLMGFFLLRYEIIQSVLAKDCNLNSKMLRVSDTIIFATMCFVFIEVK